MWEQDGILGIFCRAGLEQGQLHARKVSSLLSKHSKAIVFCPLTYVFYLLTPMFCSLTPMFCPLTPMTHVLLPYTGPYRLEGKRLRQDR